MRGICEGMEPTGSVVDPFPSETQMRMVEREEVDTGKGVEDVDNANESGEHDVQTDRFSASCLHVFCVSAGRPAGERGTRAANDHEKSQETRELGAQQRG